MLKKTLLITGLLSSTYSPPKRTSPPGRSHWATQEHTRAASTRHMRHGSPEQFGSAHTKPASAKFIRDSSFSSWNDSPTDPADGRHTASKRVSPSRESDVFGKSARSMTSMSASIGSPNSPGRAKSDEFDDADVPVDTDSARLSAQPITRHDVFMMSKEADKILSKINTKTCSAITEAECLILKNYCESLKDDDQKVRMLEEKLEKQQLESKAKSKKNTEQYQEALLELSKQKRLASARQSEADKLKHKVSQYTNQIHEIIQFLNSMSEKTKTSNPVLSAQLQAFAQEISKKHPEADKDSSDMDSDSYETRELLSQTGNLRNQLISVQAELDESKKARADQDAIIKYLQKQVDQYKRKYPESLEIDLPKSTDATVPTNLADLNREELEQALRDAVEINKTLKVMRPKVSDDGRSPMSPNTNTGTAVGSNNSTPDRPLTIEYTSEYPLSPTIEDFEKSIRLGLKPGELKISYFTPLSIQETSVRNSIIQNWRTNIDELIENFLSRGSEILIEEERRLDEEESTSTSLSLEERTSSSKGGGDEQ